MKEDILKDILAVLKDSIAALELNDSKSLREISNHTIHNSSIYQDKDSLTVAVVIYALSKVIERSIIPANIIDTLDNARKKLEASDIEGYENCLADVVDVISKVDTKINLYTRHILNQAGIRKGSKIYEHGISLARTAEILNLSQWELMKYIGQTKIADKYPDYHITAHERLLYARSIFGMGVQE